MRDAPSPPADSIIQRQRALAFFEANWPPKDAQALYSWGWSELPKLGKEVCLRAVLAAYESGGQRQQETPYERTARRAAEGWVLNPNEDTRKVAGRIASEQLPLYSFTRMIANMAGSQRRWPTAVGFGLTSGNPANVSPDRFRVLCEAIEREVLAWARGTNDPVAERQGEETRNA